MTLRIVLAIIHLLGLGVGLGSIWARARALRGALDRPGLGRVLEADTWWGISAFLWIASGLVRAFGGFEKGSAYYLHNHVFWSKMTLLIVILLLEIAPMVTFIRWRIALAKGDAPDVSRARRFAVISHVQAVLVVLMVVAAVLMARGIGYLG